MPAQPLPHLEEPFELNKTARSVQKKLNSKIAEFNGKLAKFDEAVAAAVDSEPDAVGNLADVAATLEKEKLELLLEERSIRMLMKEYFPARNESQTRAVDAAHATIEEVRERLHQGLLAMGYVDGMIAGTNLLSIIPEFYTRHPEMVAARQAHGGLRNDSNSPHEQPNRERVASIDEEIRAVRDRILRVARR